jgi:cytoskeletal protein RodZ
MAEIGSTLRETRMRARIDISEVEAHTKIRAKYLRAIENEEWDLLPGPVYVKSFLKTYGDYLGLDSRLLLDEFKRRYESPTDHELRPMAARSSRERERAARGPRRPLVPPAAAIVVVLVAVVAVLYLIGRGTGNKNPPVAGTPTHPALTDRHRHSHGSGSHTTTTTHHTTPPVPTIATLALGPVRAPVWVCVENSAGKRLINGVIYQPGATIPTQRGPELLVTLGNANLDVKINDKAYPLTPSATAIGLRITPTGAKPLTPGPTCA